MSLIVIAGIAGGVAAAGALAAGVRWMMRRVPSSEAPQLPSPAASPPSPEEPSFEAFGLALGDVVMLRDTEAWLTSALRITESGVDEACLFFTDGDAKGAALLVRPPPRRAMFRLEPVELPDLVLAPHTIEHERELFTRTRRVPVSLEAHGRGCPKTDAEGTWSWFDSQGEAVIVVLQGTAFSLTWKGQAVEEAGMIRLAAGKATFREE